MNKIIQYIKSLLGFTKKTIIEEVKVIETELTHVAELAEPTVHAPKPKNKKRYYKPKPKAK
jgi:hypothetical protein